MMVFFLIVLRGAMILVLTDLLTVFLTISQQLEQGILFTYERWRSLPMVYFRS